MQHVRAVTAMDGSLVLLLEDALGRAYVEILNSQTLRRERRIQLQKEFAVLHPEIVVGKF